MSSSLGKKSAEVSIMKPILRASLPIESLAGSLAMACRSSLARDRHSREDEERTWKCNETVDLIWKVITIIEFNNLYVVTLMNAPSERDCDKHLCSRDTDMLQKIMDQRSKSWPRIRP